MSYFEYCLCLCAYVYINVLNVCHCSFPALLLVFFIHRRVCGVQSCLGFLHGLYGGHREREDAGPGRGFAQAQRHTFQVLSPSGDTVTLQLRISIGTDMHSSQTHCLSFLPPSQDHSIWPTHAYCMSTVCPAIVSQLQSSLCL